MRKKFPKIKIIVVIAIILGIGSVLNNTIDKTEEVQKVSLSIADKRNFYEVLMNKNKDTYYIDDIDTIVLYNTVMLPMEQVFEGIFGNSYTKGVSQELTYDTVKIDIQLEKNKVDVPKINIINGINVDNSVEVEIEEVNGVPYIPLYLISNLPTVRVKIDNKYVYEDENYLSGTEALNNGKVAHNIVIETDSKEDTNTYAYEGQNLGALWREEALKRIEKNRKKDVTILVKNQNGVVLDNATVQIQMLDNEFKFGTAVRVLGTGINKNLFNIIGAENYFKWGWISKDGYANADTVVSHAKNNNMKLRGHTLWWDYACCDEVKQFIGNKENPQEGTMAYVYEKYNQNEITREQAELYAQEIQEKFETIVLQHIEEEVTYLQDINEWDVVNEIMTQQYFKYYLYDRHFLTEEAFLNKTMKEEASYVKNEEYSQFLAKCFDTVRELKSNDTLVLNDNLISGYINANTLQGIINAIKDVRSYTNNIDVLGIQYHVNNNYNKSPQSYYNSINKALTDTRIQKAAITEYDNYVGSKKGKYTAEENKTKADYLRDSLIMAYSNQNINEFVSWVYFSDHFEKAEKEAYKELMQNWLNYEELITTSNGTGCSTRLHKGKYTAEVKLGNKQKNIQFDVSDTSNTILEVVFESNIENIEMDTLPSKITYYQNAEELMIDGGKINVHYDDGTVEKIDLTDTNVVVTGFDNTHLGEQTIKVTYQGKETAFAVTIIENIPEKRLEQIQSIKDKNSAIRKQNIAIYSNNKVLETYNSFITELDKVKGKLDMFERIETIYQKEMCLMEEIVVQYNAGNIQVPEEEFKAVLYTLINLSEDYKILYSYYAIEDTIDINTQVRNPLNDLIKKYNANIDADLTILEDLLAAEVNIYENGLQTDSVATNYLNKQRIIQICPILSKIMDKKIEDFIEQEKSKLQIVYNHDINVFTNQDVIATLQHGTSTIITNNDGKDQYTFQENNTFTFEVSIKGNNYKMIATVNNIDKTLPEIKDVIEGKVYTETVTPRVIDINLQSIELYANDERVNGYTLNDPIEEEGIYKLRAIDKAGNISEVNFQILKITTEGYQIEKRTIKNIQPNTSMEAFEKELGFKVKYEIQRNGKTLEKTKTIATGDILITENKDTYTLIVAGDINKDGIVNIKDIVKMRIYLLERNNLDVVELLAADANIDAKPISIKDLVRMRIMVLNRK